MKIQVGSYANYITILHGYQEIANYHEYKEQLSYKASSR